MARVRKFVRPVLETLLAGVFIGYVGGIIVGQAAPVATGTAPGEPREAHAFMGAVYRQDFNALASLGPELDPITRALQLKANAANPNGADAETLTYLGGETRGRLGVHLYAIGYVSASGQRQLVPYVLTVGAGRVLRIV